MAVLAKPIDKMSIVKEKDSKKFIEDFNKNVVSKEFIDSCEKAGNLFGKKR